LLLIREMDLEPHYPEEAPTVDLAARVAFLRGRAGVRPYIEAIETHLSWVFLTETRALKLKKPVQLPYLDYSTVELRRACCVRELRLGRRLAASVYIHVVPMVWGPQGIAIGGPGEIVDWVLVMRRLPEERMLPEMLARGAATLAHADALGARLAAFYAAAPRATWAPGTYPEHVRSTILEAAGELAARGASRVRLGAIVVEALDAIDHHGDALVARARAGRVVEAHGDLRPEHVCLETPPVVIDPLEFDDDLRTLDAASELTFFSLECERLGARWFGSRVVARYAALAGDHVEPGLLAIYRAQHALTRALIALRHLDDAPPERSEHWRTVADDYLERARVPGPPAAALA